MFSLSSVRTKFYGDWAETGGALKKYTDHPTTVRGEITNWNFLIIIFPGPPSDNALLLQYSNHIPA